MEKLEIGMMVVRLGADTNSSTGRTGEIIEIDQDKNRFRVHWRKKRTGVGINVRTWVNGKFLQKINPLIGSGLDQANPIASWKRKLL